MEGLKYGFPLIDCPLDSIKPAFTHNHHSALLNAKKVEERLKEEIEDGNYIQTVAPPLITSALAAIPKTDGSVRVIHDLSRPMDNGVNSYANKEPCEYQSFNNALQLLKPESYIAKVDLQWAYRSVAIRDDHQTLTGIQWKFKGDKNPTFLVDKRLPFGARKSPSAFNRVTKAVQRMMERRGFKTVVFLDDFFLCEDSFQRCLLSLNTLISLLRSLNFRINWKKVVDPCRKLTFLGIQIDLDKQTLSLEPTKVKKLCETLQKAAGNTRLSKKQLQSLCGKLSWASVVNVFGRAHLAPFFHLIRTLKAANHKSRLSDLIVEELNWWLACLNSGNNTKDIWDKRPCLVIATDASQVGGGAFCQCGDSLYINFILDRPMLAYQHINIKELAMVKEAVHYWAPQFEGHHLSILTDNQAAAYMINKGYSKHHIAATLLREIALICQRFNCNVSASYIPGVLNDIPDAISRFHQFGQYERFVKLVNQLHADQTRFKRCTISPLSHLFIFQRHQINSAVWTKKWQH